MTVPSELNKHIYQGNGVTTRWPYTFTLLDAADLKVYLVDAAGTETLLTQNYRVLTASNEVEYPGWEPGTEPPLEQRPPTLPSTHKIVLLRDLEILQETDLVNNTTFYAQVHETAFDRLTMYCQQLKELIGRSLRVGIADATSTDVGAFLAAIISNASAAQQAASNAATSETNALTYMNQCNNYAGYTKDEANTLLGAKANTADVNTALGLKANAEDVYTKTQTDDTVALSGKNYVESATSLALAPGTGLQVAIAAGNANISGTKVTKTASAVSVDARTAALVTLDRTGTLSKVNAKAAAADIVDTATVGFWSFADWDGSSAVSNGAVGVNGNTVAVANNLTKTGTVTRVDGHAGYAAKGDGSTGYFASANTTGFPTGAAERELNILFTPNSVAAGAKYIARYGGGAGESAFGLYLDGARLRMANTSTTDTGYDLEAGKPYLISFGYDGANEYVKINGQPVYVLPLALVTALASYMLTILANVDYASKGLGTVHFVELRNKMRTPAQIAALSNKLLMPCRIEMRNVLSSAANAISGGDVNSTYSKDKAFDGLDGTRWASSQTDAAINGAAYIGQSGLNSNVTQIAYQMYINAAGEYYQTSLKAQWSIDGTTWYDITTFSGIPYSVDWQTVFFDVPTYQPTSYPHRFRLLANSAPSASGGDAWYVRDLKFYGDTVAGYSDIRSILPADTISLGMVLPGSTALQQINHDYQYGRREGAYGGNRIKFLGWKYFNSTTTLVWDNPFGTRKAKATYFYAEDAAGKNETQWFPTSAYADNDISINTPFKVMVGTGGLFFASGAKTSGYIGLYAEVIE